MLAASLAGAAPYADCAQAADPPACLVAAAAPSSEPDDLLDAIILAGASPVIEANASRITQAVRDKGRNAESFGRMMGIQLPPDPAALQAQAADSRVLLAAIALAAASLTHDDPFEETLAKTLSERAKGDPAVAQIAVKLRRDADTYQQWAGNILNTRPRGMPAIWRAVIAQPSADSVLLAALASEAGAYGYRAESLALVRIALARGNLSNELRAQIASQIARWHDMPDEAQRLLDEGGAQAKGWHIPGIRVEIASARLRRGYDAAAAKVVVDACLEGLNKAAFYSYAGQEELEALEAGQARSELLKLGEAYLAKARVANDNPEDKGQWFALASEAFRRGGDKTRAVSAAREGLSLIAPAVAERGGSSQTDKRAAAVAASGFGTAPVVALYRAGARDDALANGYLTGLDRFDNARIAGEVRDPLWVIGDRSAVYAESVIATLISDNDAAGAVRLYDGLRCASVYEPAAADSMHRSLALLAALSGRRGAMHAHLAKAAEAIDRGHDDAEQPTEARAYAALAAAADWRRSLTIAERVGAKDDALPGACAAK
jgi:hypothetical protein